MNDLEKSVMPTLDSWITGQDATLKRGQVETLASWVTKTALTYALYYRPKDSPFRSADYAEFFQTKRPFKKSIIWVAFSDAPTAFVSAYLEPFWIQRADEESVDPDQLPTAASFSLGAHGVVFLARFWMNMPIKPDNALTRALTKYYFWNLPRKATVDLQRIEPPRRKVRGPVTKISPERLDSLRNSAAALMEAGGLPLEGLTEAEVSEVRKKWREGSDPAQLRQEFPQDGDE
jgi:hypothetical protein